MPLTEEERLVVAFLDKLETSLSIEATNTENLRLRILLKEVQQLTLEIAIRIFKGEY